MKKIYKIISLITIASIMVLSLSACKIKIWKQFEDWVKTIDDGFIYYYNDGSKDGVYILDIPDVEELTIPEYIDGKKVVELGHLREQTGYLKRYIVVGENTKKLTIQHQFDIREDAPVTYYVDFPNLTNLTFIDFLYCNQSYSENEIIVPHYIGKRSSNVPTVELKKSNREYSLEDFKAKVIIIPDYVETIEAGVFDGLTDVTIKTSYETKPAGWEDGWNGNCEVVWSEEITYLYYYDWIKTTEDGFTYYYNDRTSEGVYILDVPNDEELAIPEYINGKKVIELAHRFEGEKYRDYYIAAPYTHTLIVQHPFDMREGKVPDSIYDYVSFPNVETLVFIDFLYCNQTYSENELIVPHYIGKKNSNVPTVELKKSDREYSLEDFKAKVIIIPDYVETIEAGVFDGLTDVTIKTSYETKPEGWADGWNGNCEVVWGADID